MGALNLLGPPPSPARPAPHNVLLTREWLLIVPRSRERFETISINALGFAGQFLVKDQNERKRLVEFGLLRALSQVAVPRGG